jgi:hypothetical protein
MSEILVFNINNLYKKGKKGENKEISGEALV